MKTFPVWDIPTGPRPLRVDDAIPRDQIDGHSDAIERGAIA